MKYQRFLLIVLLCVYISSSGQKKIGLSVSAGPSVPLLSNLRNTIVVGWEGPYGFKETDRMTFSAEVQVHFFQNHSVSFITGAQLQDKGYKRKNVTSPGNGTFVSYIRPSTYYAGIPLLLDIKPLKHKAGYFFGQGGLVPEFCLMNKNKNLRTSGLSAYFSAGYSFKGTKFPLFAKIIYEYGFTDLYEPLMGSNYNTRVNYLGALVGVKLF